MTPSIIVDSAELIYVGEQWQAGADSSTFSGTYNICRTDVNATNTQQTMIFGFDGSAVSFYGQPTDGLKMNYTFDGSSSRIADTSFPLGIPGKTGVRLWGVENVTATSHSISLIMTAGRPIIDYVVVTPDRTTFLGNKILALDDTDSAIKYSGNWTSQSGTVYPSGLAYNNTRHGSTTAGDRFTITFTGASISVYGILNQITGKHSSTYSIDGGTPSSYEYVYNTTQPVQPDTWTLHQKFFSKNVIPGQHTLTVTISEVSGSQAFWLDYVLFEGIASTTLSPAPPPVAIKQKSYTKLIEGVVIAVVVVSVIVCCLRCLFRGKISQWLSQFKDNRIQNSPPPMPYPVPAVTPSFLIPVGTHRDDDYETRRLRIEMENLRRENERIRLQAQSSPPQPPTPAAVHPQTRVEDAGPADSPPAYSPTNYIP